MTTVRSAVKRAACAVCAAVIALCACSCGLKTKNSAEKHIPVELPTSISVSWWGNEIRSDYTVAGINEYENSSEGIDIVPFTGDFSGYKETLDSLMSCRKEPDIVMINSAWLPEYSPDGEGFADLNEYSDVLALDNFSDKELSYGTMNGKLNAIPIALNAITFYYNKTILDQYELSVPKTWDDLFDCAEVLWKDGIYTIESSYKHYWKMLIAREEQLTGLTAFEHESFDVSNVMSMMEFLKRLHDENVIPAEEYAKPDFLEGHTAGAVLWVSDAQFYVSPLVEEMGQEVVIGDYLLSQTNRRFGYYVKPTSLYAVSKNSEHPGEAAQFLNYLMNDSRMAELQGIEKGIPLSRSALETLEAKGMLTGVTYDAAMSLNESGEMFELMHPLLEDNDRINKFFEYFDLYYYGRISLEEAAETFITEYPFVQ